MASAILLHPARRDLALTSGVLLLALGASACGPRATRVVTAPNGDPAFLVECNEVANCASRATEVCPQGYDVLSAGETTDPTLELFLCPTMNRSCRHDLERNQMMVQCKASPTLPGPPTFASAPPPRAAAGFALGASIAEMQEACVHGGHSFGPFGPHENGWLRCAGFLEDPGFRGFALLKTCADSVCAVRLVVEPEKDQSWLARTTVIALALGSQFGTPRQGTKGDFVTCAADPDTCMQDPKGQVEFSWRWPDGHRVALVTKANHPHLPLTTVTYLVSPRSKTPASQPAKSPTETKPANQLAPDAGSGKESEDAGVFLDGGTATSDRLTNREST